MPEEQRPFDNAQGRPFDKAQGRPFDNAQGKPFDNAQGRQLTEDERAQMRQWIDNWRVAGPFLEQERWTRVAALTDEESWNESQGLFAAWEPEMLGDGGEGLLLQPRVFERARRNQTP